MRVATFIGLCPCFACALYVVQVGVIGKDSCRDERRQSRIVSGNDEELRVYSVNHHKGRSLMEGVVRLMLRGVREGHTCTILQRDAYSIS